jgi:uncharacterized protein (DUF302 family)
MTVNPDSGIVIRKSDYSVDQTLFRLEEGLRMKGVTIFAVIDHSCEAARVGLHMPNTKLVIFGNPKAGTPLMIASPTAALDLPLRILISEDGEGNAWLSWNSPAYVLERHGLSPDLIANIAVVEDLARAAGNL